MRKASAILAGIVVVVLLALVVAAYIDAAEPPPDLPGRQTALGFAIGLLIAVVIGGSVVRLSRKRIYGRIDREYPREACEENKAEPQGQWLPQLIGTLETFTYFLLFSFEVPGAGTFAIAWIVLKMATGWNWFERKREWTAKDRFYRRKAFGALTLNLLNVLFGVFGAQVFIWLR